MSATLREVLAQRATDVGTPDLDLDELVARGEHRLRRRRTTAVLGAAAAVVVVLAIALVVGTLNGPVKRGEGPVDTPTIEPPAPAKSARQIVYSDVPLGAMGREVHLGDRVVDTGVGFVHLDVTDAGFVYAYGAGVWFSDGGAPQRIGSELCGALPTSATARNITHVVVTGNAGSLAAWLECARAGRADLVVFDTGANREVARTTLTSCREFCTLIDVTRGYAYFDRGSYTGAPDSEYRLDLQTGRVRATTPGEYAGDIAGHARGLVVGDSWRSGAATNGIGQAFRAVGSRLVPQLSDDSDLHDTRAFDTATGRVLRLSLPPPYRTNSEGFLLFEWLDDDTVALGSVEYAVDDIFICQLSDGHCRVVVPAPGDETKRVVASLPLPG
jgi:hypothetical protein